MGSAAAPRVWPGAVEQRSPRAPRPQPQAARGCPVGQTEVVAAPDARTLVSCRSALEAHGVAHAAGLRAPLSLGRSEGREGAEPWTARPRGGSRRARPTRLRSPPARSPSSPSARCGGQAGALRRGRDRPVYARRAEALRRHRSLVRRAGGQGRDALRRANRREADRRDRPPSGATPPPACRAAMAAGRPPPATGRSGVQTTPRSTASTRTALHRCRLSAGHRRCGRRRWGRCEC